MRAESDKLYICPGEQHPISRAVHLARLAAFYPACRSCPLRGDTGQLAKHVVECLQSTERRAERASLFTADGARGVHLNELSRRKAENIAAAFAAHLWNDAPLLARTDESARIGRRSRPTVVLAQDERPSSPDVATGALAGLRQMGCQVVDLGIVTRACFSFSVDHLQASGGVYVTGSGCGPAWTGMDFCGRGAQPLSQAALKTIESRLTEEYSRPTRQAGTHRYFQAAVPYEAGLWKHFHALRPLTVVCGTPSRVLRALLSRIFETLPCRLVLTELPLRVRDLADDIDPDVQRVGRAVKKHRADLGLVIDDDGLACAVVDEAGDRVPDETLIRLLAELVLTSHGGRAVVLTRSEPEGLPTAIEKAGGRCVTADDSIAAIFSAMREESAVFGSSASRFWFGESYPTCDAILTLARILELLSRSDAALSEVAAPVDQAA